LATISAIPAIVPAEFFKPNGADAVLSALKTEVRKVAATLDISTPGGREAIASLAYKVARSKTALDEQGKDLVSAIKKQSGEIDAERKRVRDELDALKDEVRKPLTDWENAEKERVAAHEEVIRQIEAIGCLDCPLNLDEIEARAGQVSVLADRDWQEFKQRAMGVKAMAMESLSEAQDRAVEARRLREQAERLEAEAAERAIKEREEAAARSAREAAERRAEEQARLAREAADRERQRVENERIEAEARAKQAEAEKIAAELKAERERIEAEERRIREGEQAEARRVADAQAAQRRAQEAAAQAQRDQEAAIERERQRVAEEQRKELEEAEKRAKNRAHQGAIHREILEALALLNISEETGKLIIASIAKGAVPHVTIEY
jgi:hypothetical protein